MQVILAIDFDGVLHDHKNPVPGRRMGPPIVGTVEAMEQLRAAGHRLIVHSVWANHAKVIEDWCRFYGVPFHEVTNIKPNADAYIDDRAIRFTTWEDMLRQLSEAD